jgi:hypothetical protein
MLYNIHTINNDRISWYADFSGFLLHLSALPEEFITGYSRTLLTKQEKIYYHRQCLINWQIGMKDSPFYR